VGWLVHLVYWVIGVLAIAAIVGIIYCCWNHLQSKETREYAFPTTIVNANGDANHDQSGTVTAQEALPLLPTTTVNANGDANRDQSGTVTAQEALPRPNVGNAVDEQKVESGSRMESAADIPEGLTKKQVVFSPVQDPKDPEQCTTTVHTSTGTNDSTSKTFKKLDDNVLTVKDCTSPASSLSPHEQSNSDLHQIAASPVVTREEENRQQTERVISSNKLGRPAPKSSAAREHGQESFAKKASMEQVYKMSQSGTSSPVPPQTYDYQKSLPPLPHREHTAIPMDDTTENAPHRSHPPASHSGSMEEVHPVTDASPLPRSQSMPCI
jgi:hypothetical protein